MNLKCFLERNQKGQSALYFQNSGIVSKEIRDQSSSKLCVNATDLKTIEAGKLTDGRVTQLPDKATLSNGII